MSAFEFEKEVVNTTRGMQGSVYDELLPHFTEPGLTLYFSEEKMKRPAASQAAKRLMLLDPTRIFHSGWDAVKKKVYIRVRPEGEVSRGEQDGEQKEPSEETPDLSLQ